MEKFYLTFGSQYPRTPHPKWEGASHKGWVEILAPRESTARSAAHVTFGPHWSNIYTEEQWNADGGSAQFYPLGCIGAMTAGLHGSDQAVFIGRQPVNGEHPR